MEKNPIGQLLTFSFLSPEKMGKDSPKLRPAYKTYTNTTINNNFPCLHWRVSEIRLVEIKKVSSQTYFDRSYVKLASSKKNAPHSRAVFDLAKKIVRTKYY